MGTDHYSLASALEVAHIRAKVVGNHYVIAVMEFLHFLILGAGLCLGLVYNKQQHRLVLF
jgi:hypothetical protein